MELIKSFFLPIIFQRIRTTLARFMINLDQTSSSNIFGAYTICHFICTFLRHLYMVELELRVITVSVKLSEYL